mmetsp:Transcript_91548/g.254883  ORF Transcript_91548/g.254883 Transcript_91548/m.254883 type:complete len:167 (-) Transcript_91548:70-570(-)
MHRSTVAFCRGLVAAAPRAPPTVLPLPPFAAAHAPLPVRLSPVAPLRHFWEGLEDPPALAKQVMPPVPIMVQSSYSFWIAGIPPPSIEAGQLVAILEAARLDILPGVLRPPLGDPSGLPGLTEDTPAPEMECGRRGLPKRGNRGRHRMGLVSGKSSRKVAKKGTIS